MNVQSAMVIDVMDDMGMIDEMDMMDGR